MNNKTVKLSSVQIFALCSLSTGKGIERYNSIIEHGITLVTLKALRNRELIAWSDDKKINRVFLTKQGNAALTKIKASGLFPNELIQSNRALN